MFYPNKATSNGEITSAASLNIKLLPLVTSHSTWGLCYHLGSSTIIICIKSQNIAEEGVCVINPVGRVRLGQVNYCMLEKAFV